MCVPSPWPHRALQLLTWFQDYVCTWAVLLFDCNDWYQIYHTWYGRQCLDKLPGSTFLWLELCFILLFCSACIEKTWEVWYFTIHCLHVPWSLPLCPWNATVKIYNFLIGCPLPRRNCLGALSFFKSKTYSPDVVRTLFHFAGFSSVPRKHTMVVKCWVSYEPTLGR